jgi:hypothetical protein
MNIPKYREIWHLDWGVPGKELIEESIEESNTTKKKKNDEFKYKHMALCLSQFGNDKIALFAPITSFEEGDDQGEFGVLLPSFVTGRKAWVLLQHIKCLDWAARKGNHYQNRSIREDLFNRLVRPVYQRYVGFQHFVPSQPL